MPERRFRDMSLTADEVQCRVHDRYGHILTAQHDRIEERAYRLLPLWREWGLRDLSARYRRAYETLREGVRDAFDIDDLNDPFDLAEQIINGTDGVNAEEPT